MWFILRAVESMGSKRRVDLISVRSSSLWLPRRNSRRGAGKQARRKGITVVQDEDGGTQAARLAMGREGGF